MTTVLIVEDEHELAALIQRHLEAEGHRALIAGDGETALALAATARPDLILLDGMLPGLDGLIVCRRLRERTITPIIMLTARAEEADRILGLEVGADDYLTKPFSIRELMARVRAQFRRIDLMRRAEQGEIGVIVRGPLRIDPSDRIVFHNDAAVSLTVKEYDLLLLLARYPGRTFSRAYLLDRIWGAEYEGSDRTVDTHVVRLRRKLGEAGESIATIWGVGYRLEI